ncbi:MAG TPA: hypothetical protein VGH14_00980 [Solirubrobacterales bacterium]
MKVSVLAFLVAVFAISVSLVGHAHAARVRPLEVSEVLPNGVPPVGVAIDSTTHDIYVSGGESVHIFDGNGELNPSRPELVGAQTPAPFRVAVDNSGGADSGDIYVVNRSAFGEAGSVQQFDPAGEASAVTITEASIPADGTAQGGGLPPVVKESPFAPRAVAVDGSGNVFVGDSSARAIDVFTPAGSFVRQIAAPLSIGFVEGIAIDGPDLYVALGQADGVGQALGPGLIELTAATGECVSASCAPIDPAKEPIFDVAVDKVAGTIFTTGLVSSENGSEGKVTEYDVATGNLLGVTRPAALHQPLAVAVDETSHKVIVGDALPVGTVKFFGPERTVPDVVTLTPESVTDRSATLKGEVGAAGVAGGATCVFQYVDQEEFELHGFEGAAQAPCEPGGPFLGGTMNAVHADLIGLPGGTKYHERILGTNSEGTNSGGDIPFTTLGPTVTKTEAVGITEQAATLKGNVNPNGAATTYRFQYLTQAAYETNPPAEKWAGATEVPAGGALLEPGTTTVPVSQVIAGLVPGTTYRMRIFATSGALIAEGEEVEFTAQQSPFPELPDDRAYERVSPTDKNGTNIQGAVNSTQASLDGERITFFSIAGIPAGEGAQTFPTYMAVRSATGWSTEGLLPPASYGPFASTLGWTEDLRDTYDFVSRSAQEGQLLLRAGPGAQRQVGKTSTGKPRFVYAGSSQGGSVALLESEKGGLKDAAGPIGDLEGKQNVYAYDREGGRVVVAGRLNNGTVPPGGAMAGPYDWFKSGSTTLLGGSLSRYYTQPGHAISADGSEIFFTAGETGQLYVRMNPFGTPEELTPAECRAPTNEAACTIRVSAPAAGVSTDPETPAAFLDASADGRLVYFLDKGKLTTNSTAGAGYDLYRYDVNTGALTDLTPDTIDKQGARVRGMLGIGGPTGEYAYFVASGKLAQNTAEAPVGEVNLYALHGTTIEFVNRLKSTNGESGQDDQPDWFPTSVQANGGSVPHASRISADGQTLLFSSRRNLTAYRSHENSELYLYHMGAASPTCVSCNPSGEAPSGSAGVQQVPLLGLLVSRFYSILTRNLSADGQRVFFDSPDRLVSADRNNVNDVYEWEADGEGTCKSTSQDGGCIFLISGGAPGFGPSWFGDADEKGENVFFLTAQSLVAQDRDELVDVYDARVGGGIPSQDEVRPLACEGEAGCRGPAAPPPPSLPTPGTGGTFPGNPKPPPACKKRQVKKHGKCVKKSKKSKSKNKNSKKKSGKGKKGGKG